MRAAPESTTVQPAMGLVLMELVTGTKFYVDADYEELVEDIKEARAKQEGLVRILLAGGAGELTVVADHIVLIMPQRGLRD
jgi:hypothetical protein